LAFINRKVKPEKAVILGLDAPIAYRVYEYAKQGLLPVFKRLIENGVYAENYLVPYPTVTPENWTTIATGANIGTHGITGFWVHVPGESVNKAKSAWNTSLCKAEYLWDAAERAGKRSIIINWPCSYPSTIRMGYQIGGTGLALNEWRTDRERGILYRADLSDGQLFTTEDLPFATKITLKEASGWVGLDPSDSCLEAELELKYSVCRKAGEVGEKFSRVKSPRKWFMLIKRAGEGGYGKVLLSKSKDLKDVFAELSPGEWSKTIIDEFETEDGVKKGAFKCKLLELSGDAKKLRLLVTPICNLEIYSHPEELSREIAEINPLAVPSHIFFDGFMWGWYDKETYIELIGMEHQYLAEAAIYLMKNKEWSLLFMHMHAPDWMYHYAIPPEKWDPISPEYEGEEKAKFCEKIEIETYQVIDRAVGRIIEAAGENSLIIVVSDHGARARAHEFSPIEPLAKAGLLTLKKVGDKITIDVNKSLAIPAHGPWIYINLKDRYEHGIVDASQYEEIQEKVIECLYSYVDPKTGERPVALALKKKDARLLGLYGERIGDVVYAVKDSYGKHHGQLPTCEYGVGSLKGLLIMSGPGLKKGVTLKSTVHATDIVPTICYLLDIPLPRNAEGGIIYQALEGLEETEEAMEKGEKLRELPPGAYQIES